MIQRELTGEYYTPDYITQLVSEFSRQFSAKRILDPACGSGGLLQSVRQVLGGSVEAVGVEINSEVFSLAKSKNPGLRFINSDFFSLRSDSLGAFDLIVCNPPFGQRIEKEIAGLRIRSGENAFILASLQLLKSNGHLVFVVPEGILFRDSDKAIRDFIVEKYSLEAVISLPVGTFKPYTGAKTSILIIKNATQRQKVFFSEYLEQSSLQQIISNYFSETSNQNFSQGFWLPVSDIQSTASWSYTRFRGALDFDIIRQKAKHPTFRLLDLLEVDNHGRKGQDALLIPRVGTGRDTLLKSELPEDKKIQNYFQFYPRDERVLLPYVKVYLNSDAGKKQLSNVVAGAFIPTLTLKSFEPLFLELPNLATQAGIVDAERRLKEITTRLQAVAQSFLSNPFDNSNILSFTNSFDQADDKDVSFENLLWPIATSYRIATKGSPNLNSQLESYFKMFEMVSAFNAIVLLSALPPDLRDMFSSDIWTQDKAKYEKVSFGLWVSLYRRLTNLYARLFKEERDKEEKGFENALPFGKDFYVNLSSRQLLDTIDTVPEKRNKVSAHGGIVPEIVARKEIAELSPMLTSVFERLLVYGSLRLIYPQSMKKSNGLYFIRVKKLEGTHYPFAEEEIQSEVDMDTEALYLLEPSSHSRLKLLPELIKLIQCESCGNWSIYFYNKMDKNKVRYVSYQNEMHDYSGTREGILGLFTRT